MNRFKFILLIVFSIGLWGCDLPCHAQCYGIRSKDSGKVWYKGTESECNAKWTEECKIAPFHRQGAPFGVSEWEERNLHDGLENKRIEVFKASNEIIRISDGPCEDYSDDNSNKSSNAKAAGDMAWQTANDNNQWVQSGLDKDKDYGHASDRTSRGNTNAEEQRNYPSVADALNGSNSNKNNNNSSSQVQNSSTHLPQSPQYNATPTAAEYEKLANDYLSSQEEYDSFAHRSYSNFCKQTGHKETDAEFQSFAKQLSIIINKKIDQKSKPVRK